MDGSGLESKGFEPEPRNGSFNHQKGLKMDLKRQSWLVLLALMEAGQYFHRQRLGNRKAGHRGAARDEEERKKENQLQNREKW